MTFNGITIIIIKSVIELFNEFYDKILFDYDNKIIIKIKYLSIFDNITHTHSSSEYYLKINLSIDSKVYNFHNINKMNNINCLVLYNRSLNQIFTNGYYEYKNNLDKIYDEEKSICLVEIFNSINLSHIKEIFIFFTNKQTNKKEKITNKFKITIADITNEYSTLDMEIYSQLHHSNINSDNQIYSIGYSLTSSHSYPNGLFNVSDKPIKIECNLIEHVKKNNLFNYQINVVLFGFNVY